MGVLTPFFYLDETMWLRFLFLFMGLFPFSVSADINGESLAWLKLLHYEKVDNKYVSLVENEDFFVSKNGRVNPVDEYESTVIEFNKADSLKKCDFPARFMLLQKEGKVEGNLDECEEYQKFLADIQPKAVTMLFTNAYMSNPSSLFGHTLFRIDTKRKGTQLLAHGANFGADTGDETGVLYALKGLWGGYYGTFGIKPYYDVINLYNNIENRDIWEYELGFSDDELKLFVAHMWEMKKAKIRYYFATKNCSYILLLMIEAVRPDLELTRDFKFYAAPLNTLKAVDDVDGFIKATNYRPSRQSKLKYRAKLMNKKQTKAFVDIIKKDKIDLSNLDDSEKADVLETAYQYVQYRYVEGGLELKDYRKKSFGLLRERSKIANNKQFFDELKDGENPIKAHKNRQLGVGFGFRNGEAFQEISFKPLYNSLMEDSYGLLKGAEINMFDAKIRHYDSTDKYVFDEFNLLKIRSLSGVDVMFSPFSYDIRLGIERVFEPKKGEEYSAGVLEVGVGQSYALNENTFLYVMTMPNAIYGGGFRDNGSLGMAFKGGIYYNKDKLRFDIGVKQNFTTNDDMDGQKYWAETGIGISRNLMLYGKYEMFNSDYNDNEEFLLGVKFNF